MQVEPERLDDAARACDDIRDRLRASAADVQPETETAIAGLPGWRTRGALERVAAAWDEDLKGFGSYLTDIAEALRKTAADYRYTDEANAANFDIRGR